jgi:UDP-N-acetylmuramoyl-L-alanyl-D-glutamate--2,6-diaminopimelate ligase
MNRAAPDMALTALLDGLAVIPPTAARVTDLTLDSRDVRPGSLYFALGGRRTHGLEFAADVAARGARVVLWDPAEAAGRTVPLTGALGGTAAGSSGERAGDCFAAPVTGLRQVLGRIADRFFGNPSAHLRVTGITGTNGKTTSAYLLAQALGGSGNDAGYMGTIGWGRVDALEVPTHTTPDVITVHRQLATLRTAGVRDVAMEVSSHALDQGRVDGVRFHSAAFTNLTRDHLDYHATMEAYGAAKARLFAVDGLQQLVINIGDAFGRQSASQYVGRLPVTAVWVGAADSGWTSAPSICATELKLDVRGLSMRIEGACGERLVKTRLMGRFNAENALLVLGCLLGLGMAPDAAVAALECCVAPPGRMEVIEAPQHDKPVAVIDYAHTPDALAKALAALREHCRGALWCVFGCGGDRDPGKRPLMGAIADDMADQIIITDDNPRSEDPEHITRAIADGFTAHRPRVIHDRGEAIAVALTAASAGDMVLIAGKGHEEYQIYAAGRRTFSDRAVARQCLGLAA